MAAKGRSRKEAPRPKQAAKRARKAEAPEPVQPVSRRVGRAGAEVMERLDLQRSVLAAMIDDVAHGLENATRRSPSPLSRQVLQAGERALRNASSKLEEHPMEELLDRSAKLVAKRPGLAIAGLLGAGVIAGRVFRARGAGADAGEGGPEP